VCRRASFFLSRQFVKHKVTVSWREQLPEAFPFYSVPRFLIFDHYDALAAATAA